MAEDVTTRPAHELRLRPDGAPVPVALVTGASRAVGIGSATCRRLAQDGFDVFFTHWGAYDASMPWGEDVSAPAQLAKDLAATGRTVAHAEVDLAERDSAVQLLDRVEAELGRPVSVLVNNATACPTDSWDTIDLDLLDHVYAVNQRSTAMLMSELCKRLPRDRAGRIVSITSGQMLGPLIGEAVYAMTKAAVDALTITLAAEVAPFGITVNSINPGPVDTGWVDDAAQAALGPRFPMGRFGLPEDAARLISFLVSDEARWITGQTTLASEGGFLRT
jgi:3-oxoacyl-[acyl-carrier protein] reductase